MACQFGMVEEALLKRRVCGRPQGMEGCLQAASPAQWMLEGADYSTEMCCRRHPYEQGHCRPKRRGVLKNSRPARHRSGTACIKTRFFFGGLLCYNEKTRPGPLSPAPPQAKGDSLRTVSAHLAPVLL